ncbi:hypothetical protein DL96DRAFT_1816503 [Flagelloscypha sp. PMI_526]|nr:hypothetical protein DL96DRAFT_1816503 [Flagelloscypha sp. PMI_526]
MASQARLTNPWLDNPDPKSLQYPGIQRRNLHFIQQGPFPSHTPWPFRRNTDNVRIVFFEFSGYGPPPNDIGNPGDIYIDWTSGYGQDFILWTKPLMKAPWKAWNNPFSKTQDNTHLTRFAPPIHPILHDRYLLPSHDGDHLTWSREQPKDAYDPLGIINADTYNEGARPPLTDDNTRRRSLELARREEAIRHWGGAVNGRSLGPETFAIQMPSSDTDIESTPSPPSSPTPTSLKRPLEDETPLPSKLKRLRIAEISARMSVGDSALNDHDGDEASEMDISPSSSRQSSVTRALSPPIPGLSLVNEHPETDSLLPSLPTSPRNGDASFPPRYVLAGVSSPPRGNDSPIPTTPPRTRPTTPVQKSSPKPKICRNCGTTTTPMWRTGVDGPLCNACGLYEKLHKRPRSVGTKVYQEPERRYSGPALSGPCANCETTSTPLWRRGKDDDVLCNACGLYYSNRGEYRTPSPSKPIASRGSGARLSGSKQGRTQGPKNARDILMLEPKPNRAIAQPDESSPPMLNGGSSASASVSHSVSSIDVKQTHRILELEGTLRARQKDLEESRAKIEQLTRELDEQRTVLHTSQNVAAELREKLHEERHERYTIQTSKGVFTDASRKSHEQRHVHKVAVSFGNLDSVKSDTMSSLTEELSREFARVKQENEALRANHKLLDQQYNALQTSSQAVRERYQRIAEVLGLTRRS